MNVRTFLTGITQPLRRQVLLLQVVTRAGPILLSLDLDQSRVTKTADISDAEILAFAADCAISPWMNRPQLAAGPLISYTPTGDDVGQALSSFTHVCASFKLSLGAIQARRIPHSSFALKFTPARFVLSLSVPDGERTLAGNLLFSRPLWDHWLAHRNEPAPPLAQSLSVSSGRLLYNFHRYLRLALLNEQSHTHLADDLGIEIAAIAFSPLVYAPSKLYPQSLKDFWELGRLADRALAAEAVIIENPLQPGGPCWRRGPNFSAASADMHPDTQRMLIELHKRLDELGEELRSAVIHLAGTERNLPALLDEEEDFSGHTILEAASVMPEIDERFADLMAHEPSRQLLHAATN